MNFLIRKRLQKVVLTRIFSQIDVYPDVTEASTGTAQAGSRFVYSSEVQQLGQLGTNFSIGLNYRFYNFYYSLIEVILITCKPNFCSVKQIKHHRNNY